MTAEKCVRAVAGFFILLSLALSIWVSPWWLLFIAFIGANLLQSAFTGFCLAEIILKRFGIKSCCQSQCDHKQ